MNFVMAVDHAIYERFHDRRAGERSTVSAGAPAPTLRIVDGRRRRTRYSCNQTTRNSERERERETRMRHLQMIGDRSQCEFNHV